MASWGSAPALITNAGERAMTSCAITQIISLEQAKKLGLKRYFTGEKCVHGHISDRYIYGKKCTECNRMRGRGSYAKNPEMGRINKSNWRKNNRSKNNQIAKKWRDNNKDKVKNSYREWYISNAEKAREYSRNWRANNSERAKRIAAICRYKNRYDRRRRSKEWREKYPDRHKNALKLWRINNPEKAKLIDAKKVLVEEMRRDFLLLLI